MVVFGLTVWSAPASAQPAAAPRAAASAPVSLPDSLPLRRGEAAASSDGPWVAVLALGLLLLAAGVVAARRGGMAGMRGWKGFAASPSGMKRLSSQPLTAHASLHAVRWNGEELLLGCTPQQVTVLARRPASADEQAS